MNGVDRGGSIWFPLAKPDSTWSRYSLPGVLGPTSGVNPVLLPDAKLIGIDEDTRFELVAEYLIAETLGCGKAGGEKGYVLSGRLWRMGS